MTKPDEDGLDEILLDLEGHFAVPSVTAKQGHLEAKQAIRELIKRRLPEKNDPNSFTSQALKGEAGIDQPMYDEGYNAAISEVERVIDEL